MTSSKAEKIKNIILDSGSIVEFTFHGIECHVDPFVPRYFHIYCGGEECDVATIDEVMTEPLFDGKCLNDIVDDIQDFDW